ncbi:MAG: MBL fold metallo-hydrolase [Nannocystales bacterium]
MCTGFVLALVGGQVGCDGDPPAAEDPIALLYASVGGADALASFETVTYEASGSQFVHSEAHRPGELLQTNTFEAEVAYEWSSGRSRSSEVRDTQFPFPLPRQFTRLLQGGSGWTDGLEGVPVLAPPGDIDPDKAAGHARVLELLVPQILLRKVATGQLSAEYEGLDDFESSPHHRFRLGEGAEAVEVFVDQDSGRLDGMRLAVHDTLLCDQDLEVHFESWSDIGAFPFPGHAELRGFGGVIHTEDRTMVEINEALDPDLFAVPPEALLPEDAALANRGRLQFPYYHFTSAMGVPFSLNQDQIEAIPLAEGVTMLVATHNSLVIEQANRIVVIEAPLDGRRSEAILGWVESEYPSKPVSHVISTHHHLDHAGGLRRFVAEGVAVIVAESGTAFLENEVVGATCSILPDTLALSPTPAELIGVSAGSSLSLDDPQVPVIAYQIDTEHAADMLIVHLPQQGITFNSDLYSPLPPELKGLVTPYFRDIELLDFSAGLAQHAIVPQVIVGGHGAVATGEAFAADVAALER